MKYKVILMITTRSHNSLGVRDDIVLDNYLTILYNSVTFYLPKNIEAKRKMQNKKKE